MANNDINRMRELNELLAKASDAYYNTGVEIMSDKQYDELYDELEALEKKTGVILSGSRTQQVGYEVSSGLQKIRHTTKMLSLDKTKSVEELKSWLGEHKGFLSWKLDTLHFCDRLLLQESVAPSAGRRLCERSSSGQRRHE